ncbi:MAG: phosphatase [Pseudomonadota bacterium]
MKKREGDLIQLAKTGQFDVIVHGCNCFCSMGAGIAAQMREHFPEAYLADLNTASGDRQKLGDYSCARVNRDGNLFTVVNGYTQYHYAGAQTLADYDAIHKLFLKIKQDYAGLKIAYPKIGAGLARGDWEIISIIIDTALKGENHTLVIYKS